MLERLIEFRSVLNALSSKTYEIRDESGNKLKSKIAKLDFDAIEIIVDGLKPIYELTQQLSLRESSVSDILPIFCMFTQRWPSKEEDGDDKSNQLRRKITAGLEKRMQEMSKDRYVKMKTYLCCIVLEI